MGGKFLSYTDQLDYAKEAAPEAGADSEQETLQTLCGRYGIPEDLIAQIEVWTDEQVKLGLREFIKRLTIKMSQSLHGFCVLRALGYHAHIESDGKTVKSLRQIAKHFGCSHQYVDKLTKDLESQLGVQADALDIEKKTYTMTVNPPQGFITLGNALKKYGLTRQQLQGVVDANRLGVVPYKRSSKIIDEKKLQAAMRRHDFSGKESISTKSK
jgi:hypothetical protein